MGCHALLLRIFPTQGSNVQLLRLLALAGGFFSTTTTGAAPSIIGDHGCGWPYLAFTHTGLYSWHQLSEVSPLSPFYRWVPLPKVTESPRWPRSFGSAPLRFPTSLDALRTCQERLLCANGVFIRCVSSSHPSCRVGIIIPAPQKSRLAGVKYLDQSPEAN